MSIIAERVQFISVEDGKERHLISNPNLIAIPSTGDIITFGGPVGYTYKVESVVHYNIFNSPGEHEIVVNLSLQK